MRWLLLKDLQILRRSPLQAVLLVAYPVLIAVLVGFAISPRTRASRGSPSSTKSRADSRVTVGGAQLPAIGVEGPDLPAGRVRPRQDRGEAIDEVSSGDALAALILPADLVNQINSLSTLTPGDAEGRSARQRGEPGQGAAVDDRISALLAEANLLIARRIAGEGSQLHRPARQRRRLRSARPGDRNPRPARRPPRSSRRCGRRCRRAPLRDSLDRVIRFAALAGDNLDIAAPLLDRLTQPIEVDKDVVDGSSPPLDIFAIAVAATLTLAFVTVLLVAGSLALEREENAFPRLTRSLVSPAALLGEKVAPRGSASASVVTLLMLGGLQVFVPLQWSRIGLWLAAILAGGAALGGGRGGARGGGARGARRLAARLHGDAADRLPLAGPLRRGRQRPSTT